MSSRWLGPLLFETRVSDPVVVVCVGTGLLAVSLASCLVPVGHAARVDPVASLRVEV